LAISVITNPNLNPEGSAAFKFERNSSLLLAVWDREVKARVKELRVRIRRRLSLYSSYKTSLPRNIKSFRNIKRVSMVAPGLRVRVRVRVRVRQASQVGGNNED